MPFAEVDPVLRDLLKSFARPVQTVKPHLPFWFLRSDGIWEVEDLALLPIGADDSPTLGNMRAHARGGFTKDVQDAFHRSPECTEAVAELLLTSHFPETRFDELMDAVGLVL